MEQSNAAITIGAKIKRSNLDKLADRSPMTAPASSGPAAWTKAKPSS